MDEIHSEFCQTALTCLRADKSGPNVSWSIAVVIRECLHESSCKYFIRIEFFILDQKLTENGSRVNFLLKYCHVCRDLLFMSDLSSNFIPDVLRSLLRKLLVKIPNHSSKWKVFVRSFICSEIKAMTAWLDS